MMVVPEIIGILLTILLCALGVMKIYDIIVAEATIANDPDQDQLTEELNQMKLDMNKMNRNNEVKVLLFLAYAGEFVHKKLNDLDKYEDPPAELIDELGSGFDTWLEQRHSELRK